MGRAGAGDGSCQAGGAAREHGCPAGQADSFSSRGPHARHRTILLQLVVQEMGCSSMAQLQSPHCVHARLQHPAASAPPGCPGWAGCRRRRTPWRAGSRTAARCSHPPVRWGGWASPVRTTAGQAAAAEPNGDNIAQQLVQAGSAQLHQEPALTSSLAGRPARTCRGWAAAGCATLGACTLPGSLAGPSRQAASIHQPLSQPGQCTRSATAQHGRQCQQPHASPGSGTAPPGAAAACLGVVQAAQADLLGALAGSCLLLPLLPGRLAELLIRGLLASERGPGGLLGLGRVLERARDLGNGLHQLYRGQGRRMEDSASSAAPRLAHVMASCTRQLHLSRKPSRSAPTASSGRRSGRAARAQACPACRLPDPAGRPGLAPPAGPSRQPRHALTWPSASKSSRCWLSLPRHLPQPQGRTLAELDARACDLGRIRRMLHRQAASCCSPGLPAAHGHADHTALCAQRGAGQPSKAQPAGSCCCS